MLNIKTCFQLDCILNYQLLTKYFVICLPQKYGMVVYNSTYSEGKQITYMYIVKPS